jgi:hypothetical protein
MEFHQIISHTMGLPYDMWDEQFMHMHALDCSHNFHRYRQKLLHRAVLLNSSSL